MWCGCDAGCRGQIAASCIVLYKYGIGVVNDPICSRGAKEPDECRAVSSVGDLSDGRRGWGIR